MLPAPMHTWGHGCGLVQAVLDRPSTQATSLPAEVRLEYGKERVAQIKS